MPRVASPTVYISEYIQTHPLSMPVKFSLVVLNSQCRTINKKAYKDPLYFPWPIYCTTFGFSAFYPYLMEGMCGSKVQIIISLSETSSRIIALDNQTSFFTKNYASFATRAFHTSLSRYSITGKTCPLGLFSVTLCGFKHILLCSEATHVTASDLWVAQLPNWL